jgi:DNA-binding response OmpR family regulator
MKILLIEDDANLAQLMSNFLSSYDYSIELAKDARAGLQSAPKNYDLIILDVQSPKANRFTVCRQIRSLGVKTPLLLLLGSNQPNQISLGLEHGADDCLVKPCDLSELLSRVRSLTQQEVEPAPVELVWGKLSLNPATRVVTYDGEVLTLRPKEYDLLEMFLKSPRQVFDRDGIIERLWPAHDAPNKTAVTNLIKDLRQRLQSYGMGEEFIETVYGVGYRLKPAPLLYQDLQTIHNRFRNSLQQRVDQIEKLIAVRDYQKLQVETHSLVGSLGTFGYKDAYRIAGTIENSLTRTPENPTKSQMRSLQSLVDQLKQTLADLSVSPTVDASSQPKVLFIEDGDIQLADSLFVALRSQQLSLEIVTAEGALDWLNEQQPCTIIMSLVSNDRFGLLSKLRQIQPHTPLLIIDYAVDNLERRLAVSRYNPERYFSVVNNLTQICELVVYEVLTLIDRPHRSGMVMVVEDGESIVDLLQSRLESEELNVISVHDPSQLWHTLNSHPPDLLLLGDDIHSYDSRQLCQVVRQSHRFKNLPIVMVCNDPAVVPQMIVAGANDVLVKPISDQDLTARVFSRIPPKPTKPKHKSKSEAK